METPKEYYYTYYSYEEWGRGYIGSRGCECLPEEDINYFGSFSDKTFKPTQKIILKDDYTTREEAYADEIILHNYYDVANNPHFVNRANATSTKFYVPKEKSRETGRMIYERKIGIHALTFEQRSENGRKSGKKGGSIGGKKGGAISGKQTYERKIGIHALTSEEKAENARKGHEIQKELGTGFWGFTLEKRQETVSKTNSQKWMCLETGYITTSGPLTTYQRARGIDTSKRKRIA